MKIKPLNNIVLAELLKDVFHNESTIALPTDEREGRFIQLRVLEVGNLIENIKKGDYIIANNLFEIIDPREPKIGFINSKDILGIIEEKKNG